MKELESKMREIEMDGLTWGGSKLVPLAFGIKKLQVTLVVEDEKVSIDDLQQRVESDEDHVQSTDVVSLFPFLHGCHIKMLTMICLSRLPCKSSRLLEIHTFSISLKEDSTNKFHSPMWITLLANGRAMQNGFSNGSKED